MKPLLISYCNLPVPRRSAVLKLDLDAGYSDAVSFEFPKPMDSCTGLALQGERIYALFLAGGLSHLAALTAGSLESVFSQPLPEVKDGHSVWVKPPYVYIVSTGTDEVLRYDLAPDGLLNPSVVWQANASGADAHHINSITDWKGRLVISALGPKSGALWATATEGYIHDISRDVRIKSGVYHPHSLSVRDDCLYYCESQKKLFRSLDAPIFELDAYTRGVCWLSDELVCVGTSVGRRQSKSTGLTANPADPGPAAGSCRVTIGRITDGRIVKRVEVGAFGPEVYDLLALSARSEPETAPRAIRHQVAAPISFNPLNYPILFTRPRRLTFSRWQEHIPFAMFLVDLLKPDVFVELGTYYGDSYCAFCQGVQELNLSTRCYAVDTWEGDSHVGYYGREVLDDLRAHHDPLYGGFSQLIQSTFDEASSRFADGTVDLLHIDGYHTYEAVKHDLRSWLPKLSARGVVLFHDIAVHEDDFGIWRLWDELKPRYPHFEFIHGYGLGVLAVGKDQPPAFQDLLKASEDETLKIRSFFSQVGQSVALQARITPWIMEHERTVANLQYAFAVKEQEAQWLRTQLSDLQSGFGWPILQRLRHLRGRLAPPGSRREQLLLAPFQIERWFTRKPSSAPK
jgi:hypothetical protein